jgi:hypothetical protein
VVFNAPWQFYFNQSLEEDAIRISVLTNGQALGDVAVKVVPGEAVVN